MLAVQMLSLNLQNIRYLWIYAGIVLGLVAVSRRTSVLDGQAADETAEETPAGAGPRTDTRATPAGSPRRAGSRTTAWATWS